jgi:uncharacterized protein (TIGR03083 family)
MGAPIDFLAAERDLVLGMARGFTDSEWDQPSGCSGWSVKDVVSHLAALYWMVVDPSRLADTADMSTEEAAELQVRGRRSMPSAEVVADYESVSKLAIEALAGLEAADFEIPLGDLGTYPARLLPAAFCFDHFTHIRADLYAPRGPLTAPLPASRDPRPVLDWVEAALSQQGKAVLDSLPRSALIAVTGPAGRIIRVGPPGEPAATVCCDTLSLVKWCTQRAHWETLPVEASGDPQALAAIRRLHLF